jgi:glycosyltransferase involved in cell wall biosynthesis
MLPLERNSALEQVELEANALTLPISIIIPTYFEEKWIGRLLQSISTQVAAPLEVIVADAQSTDKTREIARSYGAIVVEGGSCPEGRNRGAKIARGEYLLFIDADSFLPESTTLLEAYVQFQKTGADIASSFYRSDKPMGLKFEKMVPNLVFTGINAVKKIQSILKKISFEWGIFMFVKRSAYIHVGGFNEEYKVGEDTKFFTDVLKLGYKYALLDIPVVTSGRRYEQKKNVKNIAVGLLVTGFAALIGAGALSKMMKDNWKRYGELGGKQYSPDNKSTEGEDE